MNISMKVAGLALTLSFFVFPFVASAQTATMTTSGNWATATNWSGSNIGDLVTETVTISNNINPTVNSGSNFTVGNTTLSNNNTLTIASGGTLNVGNSSNSRNVTTNNNANITVNGTLIIWGNLIVNNNIVWNITGSVIIKGNVSLSNNANLNVTGGSLQVGGNFSSGNNVNVSVPSGSISIAGAVSVGNGSNLNGCTGCFSAGGGCSGPNSFCTSGALPITLGGFGVSEQHGVAKLSWITLSEINFDRFEIETSNDGVDFETIGEVVGHGNSREKIDYSFDHTTPVQGRNYYRLKIVDFDASFEYSRVVFVDVVAARAISVFPNPVSGGKFQVVTNFAPGESDRIQIYNSLGRLVAETTTVNQRVQTFDCFLEPGVYLVSYLSGSEKLVARVLVR